MNPKYSESVSNIIGTANQHIFKQASDWFAKINGGRMTAEEGNRFRIWLEADPVHKKTYREIERFWHDPGFRKALSETEKQRQLPRFFNRNWLAVSAVAAGFAIVAALLQTNLNCINADYCTAVGETSAIQLADGSRVTLNSASAIKISFQDRLRQVQLLHGEAFFDVRRDPEQPFVVASRYSQTRVLGTRFNVREDEGSDTVTVSYGVVSVNRPHQEPFILHADDQITVGAEKSDNVIQASSVTALAWVKGHLLFDNTNLGKVVAEIGRYRKGTIIVKNHRLKALKVSGRFTIADTDKALDALEQTLPIHVYRLTPWLVVIA